MTINRKNRYMAILMIGLMLCGCSKATSDEDSLVLLEKEAEEPEYGVSTVTRQYLEETVIVRTQYKAVRTVGISFDVDGKVIQEVYVKEGDKVKKGQLMATLIEDDIENKIEELEYGIEKNEILLHQLLDRKERDIAIENARYAYVQRGRSEHAEILEQIEAKYKYAIEDYEDDLYFARLRLEELQQEIEGGKLYATMSGTVVYVKPKMEGTQTIAEERVFTITDSDESLFVADKPEDAIYFTEGEIVDIEVTTGDNKGTFEVLPYKLDKVEEEGLRFVVADGDISKISLGSRGNITIVLDSRENVLCVEPKALHQMDGKYFVYVLKEDGSQETKWVEIGLRTKKYVEIMSGLEEGEKVILR